MARVIWTGIVGLFAAVANSAFVRNKMGQS